MKAKIRIHKKKTVEVSAFGIDRVVDLLPGRTYSAEITGNTARVDTVFFGVVLIPLSAVVILHEK